MFTGCLLVPVFLVPVVVGYELLSGFSVHVCVWVSYLPAGLECHACLHTAMRTRVPTSLNLKFQEDASERVMNCVCVCQSFPTHLTLFSPVTERLVCHLGIISLCHLRLTTGCRAAVPAIVVLHCIQGWGLGFGGWAGS